MRLVLVHGINNENNSAAEVEAIWMSAMRAAWQREGLEPLENLCSDKIRPARYVGLAIRTSIWNDLAWRFSSAGSSRSTIFLAVFSA